MSLSTRLDKPEAAMRGRDGGGLRVATTELKEGSGAAGAEWNRYYNPPHAWVGPCESTAHEFLRGLVQLLTVVSDTCD
jgi:hypothetical protein